MSRAQGINVDFVKVLGLMLSNGLVALASALYCQYQGFADVNAGRGAIVIGLAAVIIGEVLFSRIFRNFALRLLGVSLGAVVYYLVIQVVLNLGLNTNDLKLISASSLRSSCCSVLEGQVFPRCSQECRKDRCEGGQVTCCSSKDLQDLQRGHGKRKACH